MNNRKSRIQQRKASPPPSAAKSSGARWTYTRRGYALAQSFRQLKSRKIASTLTLLVFGITLALPALIWFTSNTMAQLGKHQVDEESLTAYLTPSMSDLNGAQLAKELLAQAGIRDTSYISKDEALAIFNAQTDIADALTALGSNPLPGAIIIYPEARTLEPARIERLANTLRNHSSIERVQFDLRWVHRLKAALALAKSIGWLLAGFLTLTALLVIGNTIRLELLRRQSEFDVSRLLGANKAFLNRPILYTGALYGFLGGIVACTIALFALSWIQVPANDLSAQYASAVNLTMPPISQLFSIVGIATLLGILGAFITLYQPTKQLLPTRRTGI